MTEELPYSIEEIRLLLSDYLDGELSDEKITEVDGLLSRFSLYQNEFSAMKAIQGCLGALPQPTVHQADSGIPPLPSMWAAIAHDLTTGEPETTYQFDFEFISAYHDGEVLAESLECQDFETQLFHNAEASRTLGQIHCVSDTLRRWGYRQEESCDVHLADTVMAAFAMEQAKLPQKQDLDETTRQLIGAHVDGELKPQETIELNRILESDEAAKACFASVSRLSDALQSARSHWEKQAPVDGVWPDVRQALQTEGLWLSPKQLKQKEWQKPFWLAAPMAAAAALLLVSWPGLQINDMMGWTSTSQDAGIARTAIASVPDSASEKMNQRSDGLDRLSQPRSSEPLPLFASNTTSIKPSRFKSVAPPSQPIIDPVTRQLASRHKAGISDVPGTTARKAPSSEEYFFKALEEQNSSQDLSNMFGE